MQTTRVRPSEQLALPHSVEAEQGVLGSIFQSAGKAIPECVEKIRPEFFYVPAHRTIYNELLDVWESGKAIDLIDFTQRLRDKKILESVGGAGG
jgi:replicative DNA helicase